MTASIHHFWALKELTPFSACHSILIVQSQKILLTLSISLREVSSLEIPGIPNYQGQCEGDSMTKPNPD